MPVHGLDTDFLPVLILLPTVSQDHDMTAYVRELSKCLRHAIATGQRYVSITPEFSAKVSAPRTCTSAVRSARSVSR